MLGALYFLTAQVDIKKADNETVSSKNKHEERMIWYKSKDICISFYYR